MASTAAPTRNSQPVIGSNKTNNTPRPIPIKHTPIVFFNAHNIIYYLLCYIIFFYINFVTILLEKINSLCFNKFNKYIFLKGDFNGKKRCNNCY